MAERGVLARVSKEQYMRKRVALTGPIFILGLLTVLPLLAITYGQSDGTRHPSVGALVAEWEAPGVKSEFCSGALIAPNVFLTAAHCTNYLETHGITQVWVTFDPVFDGNATLYSGTMHTNPDYNKSQSDPGDVAVIVLDQPLNGITPALLPPAGYLDALKKQNLLHDTHFTAVGYGVHQRVTGHDAHGFTGTTDVRWFATSGYNALTGAWLRLSQNSHLGDGGTCYGDSGGPNFIGSDNSESNIIAAITVTGDTMCVATNVTYRLDTISARAFLQDYVGLP